MKISLHVALQRTLREFLLFSMMIGTSAFSLLQNIHWIKQERFSGIKAFIETSWRPWFLSLWSHISPVFFTIIYFSHSLSFTHSLLKTCLSFHIYKLQIHFTAAQKVTRNQIMKKRAWLLHQSSLFVSLTLMSCIILLYHASRIKIKH